MNRYDLQPFYPARSGLLGGRTITAPNEQPVLRYQFLIAFGVSLIVFALGVFAAAVFEEPAAVIVDNNNTPAVGVSEKDRPENASSRTVNDEPRPSPDGGSEDQAASQAVAVGAEPGNGSDPPADEEPIVEDIDSRYGNISQEVKDLAQRLGLTDKAKRIFYDHDPQIFESETADGYDCRTSSEEVVVYGCWQIDSIDILRTASMETTVAHELLHAIYYDLYTARRSDELNGWLKAFRQSRPEEVNAILEIYEGHYSSEDEETRQWAELSELHSFIGTQFDNLGDDLENHYAAYFKDRTVVVAFYKTWHDSTERKRQEARDINQGVRLQDVEYQECVYDHGLSGCESYKTDREAFETYGECLTSHRTHIDECLAIKPALVVYEN